MEIPIHEATNVMLSAWEKAGIMGVFIVIFILFISIMTWLVVRGNIRFERAMESKSISSDDLEKSIAALEKTIMAQLKTLKERHADQGVEFKDGMKSIIDAFGELHHRIDRFLERNAIRRDDSSEQDR